jgi:hypothetical protein
MTIVSSRSSKVGPTSRPVAIPNDFDVANDAKASGVVVLPNRIRWSEPDLTFDLDATVDRLRVYEIVLVEGTESDVRFFVKFDELVLAWEKISLPAYVRKAWQDWFKQRHIVVPTC